MDYCEYCGKPGYVEVHHIKSRGSGGSDHPLNLIKLCVAHHREAQEYRIDKYVLVALVARRESVTPEEVCKAIGLPVPEEFPSPPERQPEPTLEELIQACISLKEEAEEIKWVKAQLLYAILTTGVTASWVASQINASASWVRKLVKTYRAFPSEDMRVPEVGFEMHYIAAMSPDPAGYLARAADEGLSTRQLRKLIKEETASDEMKSIIEEEEEKEMREARRVLMDAEEVISKGGPAAEWLRNELKDLVLGMRVSEISAA